MLRRLIGEDVELVTMLGPELAPVRADPTQVEQVIINLAVNARDAMPHGGSVTIETRTSSTDDGAFVELRLTDTGVGMTDAERRQLFDPFFTTKEGGTGLGLATVYGIVEQSGGTIEVESAPGLGSSFRILLPAEWAPLDGRRARAVARSRRRTGEETILLVEDELVVRRLVAEILESSGYTVLQAADGPSALELLRRHTGPRRPARDGRRDAGHERPGGRRRRRRDAARARRCSTSPATPTRRSGTTACSSPASRSCRSRSTADVLTRKVREVLDGGRSVD